jgi:hypothetical protein
LWGKRFAGGGWQLARRAWAAAASAAAAAAVSEREGGAAAEAAGVGDVLKCVRHVHEGFQGCVHGGWVCLYVAGRGAKGSLSLIVCRRPDRCGVQAGCRKRMQETQAGCGGM